ncbi:NAD(P)-binding protein [Hypoxylon crocopeplum]|nr:NAD(P)-binding protein [Hypoxylon crocopeplum]
MSSPTTVGIIGATGRTGKSVVDGLLASETDFEITALARPSSIDSAANNALRSRGVHVVAADLTGSKEDLVKILKGIDVVISCIVFTNLDDQIPLAEAAKQAGVKRFVPCDFSTPMPRGVMEMHDKKEDVLAAVQRLYLPYTVIDVGWWSEHSVPAVPSGRTDQAVSKYFNIIPGNGTVPNAYTDASDIGTYVAKIITDPRTLNKRVFAYTEVLNANQLAEIMEELSGEKVIRNYLSADEIQKALASSRPALVKNPTDFSARLNLVLYEYINSWGFRGDNTPESAAYLGYLDFKELYPGVTGKTMRTFFQEILDGKKSGH